MRAAASSSATHRNGAAARAQARAAGRTTDQHQAQTEEAKVEAENEAEADKQKGWRASGHVAVVEHGVANPVAVAHVPEHAAEVGNQKCAAKRAGMIHSGGAEDCPQKRDKAKPREYAAPGRHGTGKGKRQLKQYGGKTCRSPQLQRIATHTGPSLMHPAGGRGTEPGTAWHLTINSSGKILRGQL